MNQPIPTPAQYRRPARPTHGLSMIEALCACAMTATTLGMSTAGMQDFILSQRLKAAAAELETTVQLARSTSMLRGETVRLAIQPLASGSCTLIHTGPKGSCTCGEDGPALCEPGEQVLRLERHDSSTGVRHLSTTASLAFSAMSGTVTPTATLKIADTRGRALHQVVNVMGRTRTCSPMSTVSGYPAC